MKAKFTYSDYGTPDTCPDYTEHSGQVVEVVRRCTSEECDDVCQPMYRIKAEDGWVGHASSSELKFVRTDSKNRRRV